MVTVGFVVEGDSDEFLPQSQAFRDWLRDECNLVVVDPVVNAGGNGNMCNRKIKDYVDKLRIQANPDKIVVLADLDPDQCAPCIEKRKEIIGNNGIDLVVIARKAIESWFLADTEAMKRWTGDDGFHEPEPEDLEGMPWDRLKEIGRNGRRGPGSKVAFAKKFIRVHKFDVRRSANHQNCPSARYFIEKLCALGAD
jgi:hypothetical protein